MKIKEVKNKTKVKGYKGFNKELVCFGGYQPFQYEIGKIYEAIRVEGLGDVEVITIINDKGEEQMLSDFFFEEVE